MRVPGRRTHGTSRAAVHPVSTILARWNEIVAYQLDIVCLACPIIYLSCVRNRIGNPQTYDRQWSLLLLFFFSYPVGTTIFDTLHKEFIAARIFIYTAKKSKELRDLCY